MSLLWVKTAFGWKCYSCGQKLGEGLPPKDVLSDAQHAVVHGQPRTMDEHQTDAGAFMPGGHFDGMSPGSFCTHCLSAAVNYPKVYDEDAPHRMKYQSDPMPTKEPYSPPAVQGKCADCDHSHTATDWPEANREGIRHRAETTYGSAEHLDGLG